jgi:hypothetical protein
MDSILKHQYNCQDSDNSFCSNVLLFVIVCGYGLILPNTEIVALAGPIPEVYILYMPVR